MTENQKPIVVNNIIGTLSSNDWLPNQEDRIRRMLKALNDASVIQALSGWHLNFNPASVRLLSEENGVLLTGLANRSIRPVRQSHVTSFPDMVDLGYDQPTAAAQGRDKEEVKDIANVIAKRTDPECIISPSSGAVKDLQARMGAEVLMRLRDCLKLSRKTHEDLVRDFVREWDDRGCVHGFWWCNQGRKKHLQQYAHRFSEISNLLYDLAHSKTAGLVVVGTVVAIPPTVTSWGDFSGVRRALQNEEFAVPKYVREVAEMEGFRFGLDALSQAPSKSNGLIERPHVTSVIHNLRPGLTEDQDRDPAEQQGALLIDSVPSTASVVEIPKGLRENGFFFLKREHEGFARFVKGFSKFQHTHDLPDEIHTDDFDLIVIDDVKSVVWVSGVKKHPTQVRARMLWLFLKNAGDTITPEKMEDIWGHRLEDHSIQEYKSYLCDFLGPVLAKYVTPTDRTCVYRVASKGWSCCWISWSAWKRKSNLLRQ